MMAACGVYSSLNGREHLSVTADKAWMVGDNFEWEVAAPQRLGINGVRVDNKGIGVLDIASVQPYLVIRDLSELLSFPLSYCRS